MMTKEKILQVAKILGWPDVKKRLSKPCIVREVASWGISEIWTVRDDRTSDLMDECRRIGVYYVCFKAYSYYPSIVCELYTAYFQIHSIGDTSTEAICNALLEWDAEGKRKLENQ